MLSPSAGSGPFVTLWTVAHQAPLSMGFSRQEYGSGLPFPLSGDLPDSGTEPVSPVSLELAGRFFTTESSGKSLTILDKIVNIDLQIFVSLR